MVWSESPCFDCPDSPCCTVLPLRTRKIETSENLEETILLLEHRYFRLGLRDNGEWMLFYDRVCRFLDGKSSKCTIFGTKDRPGTCAAYSPHGCWYRGAFSGSRASKSFILFDAGRLRRLGALLSYDVSGEIAGVPSWEEMTELACSLPLEDASRPREERRTFAFKTGIPFKEEHFELFRFRLGFPGVRLGIAPSGWYTVVESEGPPAPGGKIPDLLPPGGPALEIGGTELLERAYENFRSS